MLVKPNGQPITSADVARARAQASAPSTAHEAAARRGTFMNQWRPSLRSADADWLYDRDVAVARARDISRNDPTGGAALNRRINSAVGFGWRLSSKPNFRALGISFESSRDLGKDIETAFRHYAYGVEFMADAERSLTFGQLLRLTAAHLHHDGENFGLVEWAADEPTLFKTRLRMIDPDRVSNPNGRPDSVTLRGGIERNAAGVPVRYWIREGHPADLGAAPSMVWNGWDRYSTARGRPQVLHAFDKLRAGQSRGVSRLIPALKAFRALSKFTDHTLEAAAVNALFLGFIKSNAGISSVGESLDVDEVEKFGVDRDEYYEENPVVVDGVNFPVLGLDDEVQMQTTARDTSGFEGFSRAILRLIAASLGVTYEELSMDFSQANYSSARAALLIAWNETLALRGLIRDQIAQPFFVAWLEEAFDNGTLKLPAGAPDFHEAINAYAECRWIGPGRGYIDPTKEIDAAAARIEAQVSTLEDEGAELDGKDWEEVLEELAREQARRAELGLPPVGGVLASVSDTARSKDHAESLDRRPEAA